MRVETLVALAGLAVLAGLLLGPWWRSRRRATASRRPLSAEAREAIESNVPALRALPEELRERHAGLVNAFVAEKHFVGCNGLAIDDSIRATIAALACLLVLGRRGHYEELRSILVYPTAFWVEDEVEDDDGLVTRRRQVLSGEAWEASRIILSWDDVLSAAREPGAGYNVALHEFAHYLDIEGLGLARTTRSGVTVLQDWADELLIQYALLIDSVDRGEDTFLDPYAAEDEAEFFAVATEDYFERPVALRAAHGKLYALLREFYGVDPAAWQAAVLSPSAPG